MKAGVFILIYKTDPRINRQRIFKSRIVDEVKSKETIPYEKSRLVV